MSFHSTFFAHLANMSIIYCLILYLLKEITHLPYKLFECRKDTCIRVFKFLFYCFMPFLYVRVKSEILTELPHPIALHTQISMFSIPSHILFSDNECISFPDSRSIKKAVLRGLLNRHLNLMAVTIVS